MDFSLVAWVASHATPKTSTIIVSPYPLRQEFVVLCFGWVKKPPEPIAHLDLLRAEVYPCPRKEMNDE